MRRVAGHSYEVTQSSFESFLLAALGDVSRPDHKLSRGAIAEMAFCPVALAICLHQWAVWDVSLLGLIKYSGLLTT